MPAKGHRNPAGMPAKVLAFYRDNPGFHRCVTVAHALGVDTHTVATCSRDLMLAGELDRFYAPPKRPGGRPVTHYGVREDVAATKE